MDNLSNNEPARANVSDLQTQLDKLRHLIVSVLILSIVVTLTLVLCLARLDRSVRQELAIMRPLAAQMAADYQKSGPLLTDFINKITEYGRTHPEFTPILVKYGITKPATAAGAQTTSPVPPFSATPQKK